MPKITVNFSDSNIDFQKVKDAAAPHLLAICRRLLSDGYEEGGEFVALNPLRNDHHYGSFKINLETGCWADFACMYEDDNASGSDIISLIAYLYEINQFEAARIVARMVGMKL